MRACLGVPGKPCARPTAKGNRCPTCRREFARHRKAEGRTGERGSTHASRLRRYKVLERAGYVCFYCGAGGADVADHAQPLALGGSDTEDNLRCACRPCNSAKADLPLAAFLDSDWLSRRRREVGLIQQERMGPRR
jgi:5-methylcytosine-specific restriction endonuclease McrA